MNLKKSIIGLGMIASATFAFGQAKFKIGGLGRGDIHSNYMSQEDTVNNDVLQKGNLLFDLGIEGKLNDQIGVTTIVRFNKDLYSFEIDSSLVSLRMINLHGAYKDLIRYEIGDIDFELSPFTLKNFDGPLFSMRNDLFGLQRAVSDYENFSEGTAWRQQGGQIQGLIGTDSAGLSYKAMFFRFGKGIEGVTPDQFAGAVEASYKAGAFRGGARYISFYDANRTISSDLKSGNDVVSGDLEFKKGKLTAKLEAGISRLYNELVEDSVYMEFGVFRNLGVEYQLKDNLSLLAGARQVSHDFYSPGAQTRRYDFTQTPEEFSTVTNFSTTRSIAMWDLVYDRSIYNKTLSRQLMAYDPKFGIAEPYGVATPNRQGFNVGAVGEDTVSGYRYKVEGKWLQDVFGEGTELVKQYISANAEVEADVNVMLGTEKDLKVGLGYALNSASRADELVDPVSISSANLHAGLDAEVISGLHLLGSVQNLKAKGVDYVPVRDANNTIIGFSKFDGEVSESMYGLGAKYVFSENTFIMGHYQRLSYKDLTDAASEGDFAVNQYYILLNIKF